MNLLSKNNHIALCLSAFCFFAPLSGSAEVDPLDYGSAEELIHPEVDQEQVYEAGNKEDLSKNDFMGMLQFQTKVKSQGQRNTCTVFSITALLEALFLKKNPNLKTFDFSEQWLQYLVALRSPTGGANGSTVPTNFGEVKKWGLATEDAWGYSTSQWKAGAGEANSVCKGLADINLIRCVYAHKSPALLKMSDEYLQESDPEFLEAKSSAMEMKAAFINSLSGEIVKSTSKIKQYLRQGIPLTLEINVYYGAWGHSAADKLGIDREASQYSKGIITHPERGTIDAKISPTKPARHSVEVMGYDDYVELTYTKKMVDGSTKSFTRKGVYYFKNSWGTGGFGSKFKLGNKRIPGFGMILQDHANQDGQFFAVTYRGTEL